MSANVPQELRPGLSRFDRRFKRLRSITAILAVFAVITINASQPAATAALVEAATDANSTAALRKHLHDLHNHNNDNWKHAVFPLLIAFLSIMGISVLCGITTLLLAYFAKGTAAVAMPALSNTISSTLASTAISTNVISTANGNGFNWTRKSGPTCYTPGCEYTPVSGASRDSLMEGIAFLHVMAVVWFLWSAFALYWRTERVAAAAREGGPARAPIALPVTKQQWTVSGTCERSSAWAAEGQAVSAEQEEICEEFGKGGRAKRSRLCG